MNLLVYIIRRKSIWFHATVANWPSRTQSIDDARTTQVKGYTLFAQSLYSSCLKKGRAHIPVCINIYKGCIEIAFIIYSISKQYLCFVCSAKRALQTVVLVFMVAGKFSGSAEPIGSGATWMMNDTDGVHITMYRTMFGWLDFINVNNMLYLTNIFGSISCVLDIKVYSICYILLELSIILICHCASFHLFMMISSLLSQTT